MAGSRILVPLSETVTVRQTIGYVASALDPAAANEVHLVAAIPHDRGDPEGAREIEAGRELVDRAERWLLENVGDVDVTVETAVLGTDEYLFGPREYAEAFEAYVRANNLDRLVLDPEYHTGTTTPLLQPLERELAALEVAFEEAPVERPARHERITGSGSRERILALFIVSYGFYLVLGDFTYWFDLLTGAAVAGLVAFTLSHVTFAVSPGYVTSPLRTVRFALYLPYLAYEIVKANLAVSMVILHPSLPIDPSITRLHARVRSGLPLFALANSITLTPGTLTVRANDRQLLVHTLVPSAREDLVGGGLERAVRFVFYGRSAARIATPEERGDAEVVGGEEL